MTFSDTAAAALVNAVARAVVATGVVTNDNIDLALRTIKAEVVAFVMGDTPTYADARDCIVRGSLSQATVLGLVVAECVIKIKGA
jgi:hypothetical protein